ncbi:MAG: hypothetical protein WC859_04460 [Elusimicrobiota bacterium]|jgi:hypothetical protein
MISRYNAVVYALMATLIAGCVPLPREGPAAPSSAPPSVKASAAFPARIAVLPLSNQAGSADGAVILRYLAVRKLNRDLGYFVSRPDETDQILHERTLTGPEIPIQVAIARQNAGILADWLGVDGVLHGELQAYHRAKLTVWVRSQVKARFWLTDRQGKTLWENAKDSDQSSFGGGHTSIASFLTDSAIPPDVMEKIRASDLSEAALDLVDDAFGTFPKR